MNKALIAAVLIFLSGSIFGEITWEYDAGAPVATKPLVIGNLVVVGSQDGVLHALSLAEGKIVWKKEIESYIFPPMEFRNDILVTTSNGTVIRIRKDGTTVSTLKIKNNQTGIGLVYGFRPSDEGAYISTDKGVFYINRENTIVPFFNSSNVTVYTPPELADQNIIVATENELIAIRNNKQIEWRENIAPFGIGTPVEKNGFVYVGARDNAIYAVNTVDGRVEWRYETNGWVSGVPHVESGTVYVGSNDGNMYALDAFTGRLEWKTKIGRAVYGAPSVGTFGGKNGQLFIGSSDGRLYVLDRTGEIMWRFEGGDGISSPTITDSGIIVGLQSGMVTKISGTRGCTINEPAEETEVGQKEVRLKGKVASENGGAQVEIRINRDGPWVPATVTNANWELKIDPANMKNNVNRIFCRVTDTVGTESEPYFSIVVLKDPTKRKSRLSINAPVMVGVNRAFTIFVNDGDDQSPIEEFKITYDGKEQIATGNSTLQRNNEETFVAKISKTGFEDATVTITVQEPNQIRDLALPAIGILVVLALIYFIVIKRFLKR